MLIKIINKLVSPFVGKKRYQDYFEALHKISLSGMNIGGGTSPIDSGEKFVLKYINKQFEPLSELILLDGGANE
jgi:hypothetical protein